MTFVPRKYFKYLGYIHWTPDGHHQWYDLITHAKLKYDDLDTMINTYHDSDSAKDFNPLYYIVNRPETQVHHTTELFDKWAFN